MGKIYLKTKQTAGNGWFFLLTITLCLWLSIRLRPELVHLNTKTAPQNICISSQLTNLPDRLCFLWTSTRDNKMRRSTRAINLRYSLQFKSNQKLLHCMLLILLVGDIATKPGSQSKAQRWLYHLTHKVFEASIRKKMEHSQIT